MARPGPQRDSAGRVYFEGRRISTSLCHQGNARVTPAETRLHLTRYAQEQGYSGVVAVNCEERGLGGCAGIVCSGVSVRYPVHAAGTMPPTPGRINACDPPCTGTALCQEGVCVPNCTPACDAEQVCTQDSTCQAAPAGPPIPDAGTR